MSIDLAHRPARPRDAASLVLLRRHGGDAEVLMGRRRRNTRFMPGYYVFPGGVVEAADHRACPAGALDPACTPLLAVGRRASLARALAVSAIRETLEETGLLLGEPGDPGEVPGSAFARMRALGLAPALGRLTFLGRAITPTRSPIRFHARFFLADAAAARGELAGDGELVDLRWVSLEEAATLPMANVQTFLLGHLARLLDEGPDAAPGAPVFTHHDGSARIRYLPWGSAPPALPRG